MTRVSRQADLNDGEIMDDWSFPMALGFSAKSKACHAQQSSDFRHLPWFGCSEGFDYSVVVSRLGLRSLL